MMKVWKYPVPIADDLTVQMPMLARPLTVQLQAGEPQLWALVDPEMPTEERRFRWVGTGRPAVKGPGATYCGTVQVEDGSLVFHLFDVSLGD